MTSNSVGGIIGGYSSGVTAPSSSKGSGSSVESGPADTIEQEFLREAKKSPVERIREAYLKAHGLTEKSLAALPSQERDAIEKDLQKTIREAFAGNAAKKSQNSFASYLMS
jgi:hypothetical protein